LVTDYSYGGPGSPLPLIGVLTALLSPHVAVVPQDAVFPPGLTAAQIQQQDTGQANVFVEQAIAAALNQLKIPFSETVSIALTLQGLPAARVLQAGDVLIAVDGKPVTGIASVGRLINGRSRGQAVTVTVNRRGVLRQFRLTTTSDGTIGVGLTASSKFPFTVRLNSSVCGGSGCGMMFALGLIDKLTPLDLTGGRFIAGTGTIDDAGDIGSVTGIKQLLAGLRGQGATVFLTPAANCGEALAAAPAGLRLVKVSTLNGAVQALEALRAGKPVPTCSS
jgi:PDZ domain-containing protein